MPLAFQSLSHGEVAFGFYNIETDSLLLDNLFFFATDFSQTVFALKQENKKGEFQGHLIPSSQEVGDLMGAIHGLRHVGYLGEIYKIWPFPDTEEGFRQKLLGHERRAITLKVLEKYARPQRVTISPTGEGSITINDYEFNQDQFRELVAYVWRGGYPTWEDFEKGVWPDYLNEMVSAYGLT